MLNTMDNLGRESESQEFKKSMAEMDEGLKSLVSMLNKNGIASVYFGVEDNGDVIGLDIGKNTLKDITDKIYERIEPRIIARIDILNASDGRKYIHVRAKGTERPYTYKDEVFVRSGESNRKAPMSEIRNMILSSGDNLIETSSLQTDLSFSELVSILREKGMDVSDDDRLRKSLDLLNLEGRYNFQAELLSDQNNIPLTVVVFKGIDRTSISIRTDYAGHSLLKETKSVIDYVSSLNETSVDMSDVIRKETSLFDIDSFKEAWINACVHNNWINRIAPTVHIFDDRLEVISYGTLPYWLSMDDFYSGKSMPVNKSLMRVFIQAGLTEHTGHGVPVIVSSYGEGAFDIGPSTVVVVMRFGRARIASRLRQDNVMPMTDRELRVLDAIRIDPKGSFEDISIITGISKSTIAKIAVKLKERGMIERVGNRRNGYWKVND